jgi:ABC-type Na+ efflux pump permease subunit
MRLKIIFTLLIVLALATAAIAQTKISGTLQCAKPDQQQAIAVGDRPNHSFTIIQFKCTYTKSVEIAGVQSKEDVYTEFFEVSGNRLRAQLYGVGTMTNGDKYYVRAQGSATLKEGVLESIEGKWSYAGGTGKLKGVKGKGTYTGKGAPDGTETLEAEGEYELPK